MKNWKPILGILLTFVLGTVTGGLIVAGIAKNRVEHFIREGAENVAPIIVKRLGGKLDLNAEQKTKLEAIVTEGQKNLRAIRNRVQPEIKSNLSATVQEIRSILTSEQKPKFEEIVKKNEKRLGALQH